METQTCTSCGGSGWLTPPDDHGPFCDCDLKPCPQCNSDPGYVVPCCHRDGKMPPLEPLFEFMEVMVEASLHKPFVLNEMQPWASFIASGTRKIVNRSYAVPGAIRGERVAIRANHDFDESWNDYVDCHCDKRDSDGSPDETGFRCIRCQIAEYVDGCEDFAKKVAGRILCTAEIIGQLAPMADAIEWFVGEECQACEGKGGWAYSQWNGEQCQECHGWGQTRTPTNLPLQIDWDIGKDTSYTWILDHIELVVSGGFGSITVVADMDGDCALCEEEVDSE